MKYIAVDETRGDIFSQEFDNAADAVKYADIYWNNKSEHDKADCSAYYTLESQNPDKEAPDHFDGSVIRTYK
jgi:hypothetical protein